MVYYQVNGRLRRDVKIAFPAGAGPSLFPEYGPQTFGTYGTADFLVLQYRQTTFGTNRQNSGGDSVTPRPDFQWLSAHKPAYRLSYDGVPIMDIYSSSTAQTSGQTPAAASEGQPVQIQTNNGVFTSEAGRFTVQAPAGLEFAGITQEVEAAGGLRLTIFMGLGEANSVYNLMYFDYPPEWLGGQNASQVLLRGARDGWLTEIDGKLIEEHAVFQAKYAGTEGLAEAENNGRPVKIKYRIYLVENRCYQLSVWIPKDGTFTAAMETFLQSFAPL